MFQHLPAVLRCCGAVLLALLLVGCAYEPAVRGLKPIFPPQRIGGMFSSSNGQLQYPSLRPGRNEFVWEPFTPPPASGGSNVCYDLRIWQVRNGAPGPLVYEQKSIPTTRHRLTKKLAPATYYFWSVRARFDLNGETRLADWSHSLRPFTIFRRGEIPARNYYRFAISSV